MLSRPVFAVLLAWSAVAGSLLGWGQVLGAVSLVIVGAAMSAVCPWGVTAWWLLTRNRRPRGRRE